MVHGQKSLSAASKVVITSFDIPTNIFHNHHSKWSLCDVQLKWFEETKIPCSHSISSLQPKVSKEELTCLYDFFCKLEEWSLSNFLGTNDFEVELNLEGKL